MILPPPHAVDPSQPEVDPFLYDNECPTWPAPPPDMSLDDAPTCDGDE